MEAWILEGYGSEIVQAISQLFVQRNNDGRILLVMAKITDYVLCRGHEREIRAFMKAFSTRFTVCKVVVNQKFNFNACELSQGKASDIELAMKLYTDRMKPIQISREGNNKITARVSQNEMDE